MKKIVVLLIALVVSGCATKNPNKPQPPEEVLVVDNQSTDDVYVYVSNALIGKATMLKKTKFVFPIGGKNASYVVCKVHRNYCERAMGTVWEDRADHYMVVIGTGAAAVMWDD